MSRLTGPGTCQPQELDHACPRRSPTFFDYAVQADGVAYKFRIAEFVCANFLRTQPGAERISTNSARRAGGT
jgi:hypothetical protein